MQLCQPLFRENHSKLRTLAVIDCSNMPKESRETLPEFVKRIRTEKGLSLNDLVKASGRKISNSWVSDLENGHIPNPGIVKLRHLARAMTIPEHELLSRAGANVQDSEPFQEALLRMLQEERRLASKENREFIDGVVHMVIEQARQRRKAG